MKKYSPLNRVISMLAITVCLIVFIFIRIFLDSQPKFYSTMEEAFINHPENQESHIGEIIFIDEYEDSITVLGSTGPYDNHVSHFMRKIQDNEVFFSYVNVPTISIIPLNFDQRSIEQFQWSLSVRPFFSKSSILCRSINRRPLYGISHDSKVYNLKINDQSVEYVVVLNEQIDHEIYGEVTVYFWYFSDFNFEPGDDIVISFDSD